MLIRLTGYPPVLGVYEQSERTHPPLPPPPTPQTVGGGGRCAYCRDPDGGRCRCRRRRGCEDDDNG